MGNDNLFAYVMAHPEALRAIADEAERAIATARSVMPDDRIQADRDALLGSLR